MYMFFQIELLDWCGEDLSPGKDKSIERFQIVTGESYANPEEGNDVKSQYHDLATLNMKYTADSLFNKLCISLVHLVGKYNGQVFEDRDVKFVLGEGEVAGIIEGVELALQRFLKGEKSRLLIKSKYAFKDQGNLKYNIPPNADVEYEVELQNFEKVVAIIGESISSSVTLS